MEIHQVYVVLQRTVLLIAHHWDNLIFVPKAKRFLGTSFDKGRGVTHGYPRPLLWWMWW